MSWHTGKPVNRSEHKPVYLVVAKDPTVTKTKIQYYRSTDMNYQGTTVTVKGHRLSPVEATELQQNPRMDTSELSEVEVTLPVTEIIRVENVTYKKPKGENNE